MKTKLEVLLEVQKELKRFRGRLAEAIEEQTGVNQNYGGPNRKYAASKRGALDLKNELTKLTQDSKYRYQ